MFCRWRGQPQFAISIHSQKKDFYTIVIELSFFGSHRDGDDDDEEPISKKQSYRQNNQNNVVLSPKLPFEVRKTDEPHSTGGCYGHVLLPKSIDHSTMTWQDRVNHHQTDEGKLH